MSLLLYRSTSLHFPDIVLPSMSSSSPAAGGGGGGAEVTLQQPQQDPSREAEARSVLSRVSLVAAKLQQLGDTNGFTGRAKPVRMFFGWRLRVGGWQLDAVGPHLHTYCLRWMTSRARPWHRPQSIRGRRGSGVEWVQVWNDSDEMKWGVQGNIRAGRCELADA